MFFRRFRFAALFLIFAIALVAPEEARAASDPTLSYKTIETAHFRVTYHTGCEDVARGVADVAESIHANMVEHVGWEPKELTEIFLADLTDQANGSATAVPYNAIRLNVTAPEDLSPLGDVDDWYTELVTHEYTHVLHVDHIRGLPAIANAIVGKTFAPNQVQPRWILEGLAVYHESARTSGGRVRSSIWDMYLRADVLQGRVATLDQMSNYARRWPQGNIWYLYGSYFIDWIARTFGENVFREVARDYGTRVVPWGINRSIRRATGFTYEELYPRFVSAMRARYAGQVAAVENEGRIEGRRITSHGQTVSHPRFRKVGAQDELVYYVDDAHDRLGFVAVPWRHDAMGLVLNESARYALARTVGEGYGDFKPDGTFVFSSIDSKRQLIPFYDLFALPPGETSAQGLEGTRVRLTEGERAVEPTVSPDGRKVVFVKNGAGRRRLFIADLERDSIAHARQLAASTRFEQSFTPRFSPDGKHVTYSVWTHGGYRDVRVVDVRDGSWEAIAHDRAQDGDPVYSPDGKYIYFHSDRGGIFNVYAWNVADKSLRRVTNVTTGAFQPEPSPDGRTLVYVGFTTHGFDLFTLPLDPSAWQEAPTYVDTHPPMPKITPLGEYPTKVYSPLRTLLPRAYSFRTEPGNFGQRFALSAVGSDIAGLHSIAASLYTEIERPEIQGSMGYSYNRLPFDASVSVARAVSPRGGFAIGKSRPPVVQETTTLASSISYPIVTAFASQNIGLSYGFSRLGMDYPFSTALVDPYETPRLPFRGHLASVSIGYSYTNAERYVWSIGQDHGFSFGANLTATHPWLASEFSGFAASADATHYFTMPWLRNHTVALHAGGGFSGGPFPGRGNFYIGNYVSLPIEDVLRNVLIQGGYLLRGYEPVAASGSSYALFNAEYRFPILNIDRGLSTLPVFVNRLTGTLFADYGTAFDDPNTLRFKLGTGAEVAVDTLLGYYASFSFRTGFAHGVHSGGGDKLYFVAAVPY